MTTKPETLTIGALSYRDGTNTCTVTRECRLGERIDVYSHFYLNGRHGGWVVMFEATYTNATGYTRFLGDYDTEQEAIRAGEYTLGLRDTY